MDKLNFVRDGMTRLPPGFRFQPTEDELIFQYLKCKILHLPLPASIIPELINVSNYDPWELPGDPEQERYFFTKKETKYRVGSRSNRTTPSGYWKATSSDKHITPSSPPYANSPSANAAMRGLKKTLVFYRGKPPRGRRTEWFMQEFSLSILDLGSLLQEHFGNNMPLAMQLEDWIICRVYVKDRIPAGDDHGRDHVFAGPSNDVNNNNSTYGVETNLVSPGSSSLCSSSSSSSSLTAVCSSHDQTTTADPYEATSSCGYNNDNYYYNYYYYK